MSAIHPRGDVLRHVGPFEGTVMRSRPGPDELAAAITVLDLCRQHEHLWRSVFRLRGVFDWSDTLKELHRVVL